jgi:hypothetical protein
MHHLKDSVNLQVEDLIVFGRPVGALVLGHLLPLLVGQVRSDQAHLHERLERLRLRPLQVVRSNNYKTNILC